MTKKTLTQNYSAMKKLLILSVALLSFIAVKAQTNLKPLQSDLTIHKAGLDTVTNSGTISQTLQIAGWQDVVTIQTSVVKLTGNPTLGGVKLYGSVDGVKYDFVAAAKPVPVAPAVDSLAVTNVSTPQIYTWTIIPSKYQYYRATYHGGNGSTQTSTVNTTAMWRKQQLLKNFPN